MEHEQTLERLLPQNLEAEEAVLGSLLIDPDAVIQVAPFLQPEDFHREKNAWVYQAILDLHERREPPDFVTVCDELDRRSQLDEVGGRAYITSLINAVPTSIHVEYYGRIVERTATLRRLIQAAGQIVQMAYDESKDVRDVVDRAEQLIFSVSQRQIRRDLTPIRQILTDYSHRIDELYRHQTEFIGIPTGFVDLDHLLGGMQRSDLLIIAARPGVGKTSLALAMAENAAMRHGVRVAIFSLEMSSEQLVARLIASQTGINSQLLRTGKFSDDDWQRFAHATGVLSDTAIFIDDTPGISATEVRTKARRLHAEEGLDMVVIDYLQLMRSDSRSENRVQEIAQISRSLKELARELGVPVIALSQLSRAVEQRQDKRPILSDLRESGALEQDADVVMFIYRDDMYNEESPLKNIAEVIVAKHRNGPVGTVQLYFQKDLARFADAELRHQPLDEYL
ncbi:MAG: replicative DNA helicase [Chloroflexi bacterium]|nr:replicative DNA helicase [Chloroflexota bacterium]